MAASCPTFYNTTNPIPFRTDPVERQCIGLTDAGSPATLNAWKAYWANAGNTHTSCTTLFRERIYSGTGTLHQYSKDGFDAVTEDFDYMFSAYFSTGGDSRGGHQIGVPGQAGYDSFQQTLISACSNSQQYQLGGACQVAASKMCNKCTVDQVASNSDLLKLCGCEVKSLDPTKYHGVSAACDPLCSHEEVSKVRDRVTGVVDECLATVCVINNIAIVAAKSTIGGVQFTQVCPQCDGSQQCKCIVDASISSIAETLGISTAGSFRQYCGENSVCMTVDPHTQVETIVDCESTIESTKPAVYDLPVPKWVWMVAGVLTLIGFLVCIAAAYAGKQAGFGMPPIHYRIPLPRGMTRTSTNFQTYA